jgi:hypothetical protein
MKMRFVFLAALPVLASLTLSAGAQARTTESNALPPAYATGGREVMAPPWSAACMTDHGPSQCDEPMWVYGSPATTARYGRPF